MDAEKKEALESVGVNLGNGLERFMGNEALYLQFLLKFLTDPSYQRFKDSLAAGDMHTAERSVHTLKGTAGNLSIEPLFYAADSMVKAIRMNQGPEKLDSLCKDVDEAYDNTIRVLKAIQG